MSKSAWIDITFYPPYPHPLDILMSLLTSGWKLQNGKGETTYLPLGDREQYDWCTQSITVPEVLATLRRKTECGERVGVAMYWQDTEVGVTFLSFPPDTISLGLSYHTIRLDSEDRYAVADVSWYLKRTVMMDDIKKKVERVSFQAF